MTLHNLIRRAIWIVPLLVCTMWLLASASASSDDGDDGPKFGPWSAPVNLGPPVNTPFAEMNPFISKDGLSLYFACFNCPGNVGGSDIWVSQRASVNDVWEPRKTLAPTSTRARARAARPFPPTDTVCISSATGLEDLAVMIFMFLDATTSATTSAGNPR